MVSELEQPTSQGSTGARSKEATKNDFVRTSAAPWLVTTS
jgi:hypothetical protein